MHPADAGALPTLDAGAPRPDTPEAALPRVRRDALAGERAIASVVRVTGGG